MRKNTRAIFVETLTNPTMRVLDLAPIAQVAREFGLALLVDGTFASPINFRPLEHGADVVITSATKYLNGHSDVVAGAVAGSASVVEEVNRLLRMGPGDRSAHRVAGGPRLRTLAVRMERHNANGLAVARWAEKHPSIVRVHYPASPATPITPTPVARSPDSAAWWGSRSRAAPRSAERMLKRLKLIAHAPSLAGVESLVSEPRLTSHRDLTRGASGGRHPRRISPPELRAGGQRGHHRGPAAGARQGVVTAFRVTPPLTLHFSPFPLSKCALPLSLPVVIRFSHVYKSYPNGALALKDVSFRVGKEFVF